MNDIGPTLDGLFEGLDGADAAAIDPTIHPGDAMFGFAEELCCGARGPARVEYFRSGHHAWSVVDDALRRILGPRYPARRPARVLDFGAGHGRITRFLLPAFGRERVTSAEADPSAVAFLRDHFGLRAQETPADPGDRDKGDRHETGGGYDLRRELGSAEGFDLVLALSVLTHLPERTFVRWLRRWLDALTVEGGLLVFTTLGPKALLPGRSMPASGLHFERVSESRVLDLDDYGTTWVTPGWMGRTLDRLTGGLARWHHVPKGLWHLQDLWLVTLDPRIEWPPDLGAALDRPTGALEVCRLSDDGRVLEVSGWAAGGRRPPRGATVELRLGGERLAGVATSGHRADAAADLDLDFDLDLDRDGGDSADVATGFHFRHESPHRLDPTAQLRLDVVDDHDPRGNGHRHVLHASSIEAGELYLLLRQTQRGLEHFRNQVAIFEASRWGKMRRKWMELKG